MKSIATLFGGFGGVDIGAQQAGLEPAWSIELEPDIAAVAEANLHHRVHVANLLDCDPHTFETVDVLHASPPCPNFSVAKANGGETKLDIALARKVAHFVTTLNPRIFTLENVWAYRQSRSWAIIQDALYGAGYWVSVEHVNAADYGVPQTRKRMIVRAVRGGFVPFLPGAQPWVGWYEAIKDLIPTLPESRFAPWQLARLPEVLGASFVMQVQGEAGDGIRLQHEPMQTVTVAHGAAKYRAFLVDSKNVNQERGKLHREDGEPAFTVVTDGKPSHMPRAWLVNETSTMEVRAADGSSAAQVASHRNANQRGLINGGRVVAMTPRALARFQSFPDWYELPDSARLAAKGIGNAVPPLLYRRMIDPLLEVA